jgi:hypothetical protein
MFARSFERLQYCRVEVGLQPCPTRTARTPVARLLTLQMAAGLNPSLQA